MSGEHEFPPSRRNTCPGSRARTYEGLHRPQVAFEELRAVFTIHDLPAHDLKPGELLMMTIRSHDQFNTSIYGLDDRYRGIHNGGSG